MRPSPLAMVWPRWRRAQSDVPVSARPPRLIPTACACASPLPCCVYRPLLPVLHCPARRNQHTRFIRSLSPSQLARYCCLFHVCSPLPSCVLALFSLLAAQSFKFTALATCNTARHHQSPTLPPPAAAARPPPGGGGGGASSASGVGTGSGGRVKTSTPGGVHTRTDTEGEPQPACTAIQPGMPARAGVGSGRGRGLGDGAPAGRPRDLYSPAVPGCQSPRLPSHPPLAPEMAMSAMGRRPPSAGHRSVSSLVGRSPPRRITEPAPNP